MSESRHLLINTLPAPEQELGTVSDLAMPREGVAVFQEGLKTATFGHSE